MLSDLVNRSQPLAPDARVLVLGGGYSGGHLTRLLRALGTSVRCGRPCPKRQAGDPCCPCRRASPRRRGHGSLHLQLLSAR